MNVRQIPTVIFVFTGLYFVVLGLVDLNITELSQLPWLEVEVQADNVADFDLLLAVLTRWIGLLLIVCGLSVLVITWMLIKKPNEFQVFAIGILCCGVLSAQCLTLISVGAPGRLIIIPVAVLTLVIAALVAQFFVSNIET